MSEPDIREAQDRFVAVWGKMGSEWGISRTMAEVHALLYIGGDMLVSASTFIADRIGMSPIAIGARPAGARSSVAPRMITRNIMVITISVTSAAVIE